MSSADAPVVPSIRRRLASLLYETILLAAIAFVAGSLFHLASGARDASGLLRHLMQGYLALVFAAYFLWCWLRGGQTLAMKTWRIRLEAPGQARLPPPVALRRLLLAALLMGGFWLSIAAAIALRSPWLGAATLAIGAIPLAWAMVDRDRQFLHDRLAGTRQVLVTSART